MKASKFLVLLLWAAPVVAFSQSRTLYASFSYIKINPGKTETYLNLINTVSPKITAARIGMGGGVLGWYMYRVTMPSGTSNAYDLVSITVVDNFQLLFDELAPPDDVMSKIFPGASEKTIAGIFEQWEASRVTVKKEIFVLTTDMMRGKPASRYAMADYIKVPDGKAGAYQKFDRETASGLYGEMIRKGTLSNRQLFTRNLPLEAPDFIVLSQTNDIVNLAESPVDKVTAMLESGSAKASPMGSVTHRELWELVQYVDEFSIKNK